MMLHYFCCCVRPQEQIPENERLINRDQPPAIPEGYGGLDDRLPEALDDNQPGSPPPRLDRKKATQEEKEHKAEDQEWRLRVEQVRREEQSIYGEVQTPAPDRVNESWWRNEENFKKRMATLEQAKELLKRENLLANVERVWALEERVYGYRQSLTVEEILASSRKIWWSDQSNIDCHIEGLRKQAPALTAQPAMSPAPQPEALEGAQREEAARRVVRGQ